jgi:RHS repeat-associated protein
MGLLDDLPNGMLQLIRSGAQNWKPNVDLRAGDTTDPTSWVPQQQQRPPLSLAGPGLPAGIDAPPPRPSRPADGLRLQTPAPTTQNLTTRALRMKGVPDADIAAATGNPELMKQLIIRHYGFGSARAPTNIGYAPYGRAAGGSPVGYSGQRVDPETGELDGNRARRDTPAWGRFISADQTGLSAGDVNSHRDLAYNPGQFSDPSRPFARPQPESDSSPYVGSTQPQPVGFECDGFRAGCQNGGSFGHNANYYIGFRNLCRDCAIRYLGIEDEPAIIKMEVLKNFEKK